MRLLIKCICALVIFVFASAGRLQAQQTQDLGDENVLVVKAYQPTLTDAYKISDIPKADTTSTTPPALKYELDAQKYNAEFKPSPIKPVKIKDDNVKKLYHGYAKGGYGNYNTYYGEVDYNALRSKDFDAGVHFRHLSATGKINDYGYPGWSENLLDIYGKKFMQNATLDAAFTYERLVNHYYGYDSPPYIYSKSDTRHRFQDFDIRLGYGSNYKAASDRIDYKAGLSFYNFADNFSNSENNFGLQGFAGKDFNGHYGKIGAVMNFTELDQSVAGTSNRTFISVQPRYSFSLNLFNFDAGANVEAEFNEASFYHLYPYVRLKYQLIDDAVSVFAELKGNMEQNNFKSLSKENPFLESGIAVKNTNDKFDIGGGINARLDHDIKAIVSASFQRKLNEPFYVNLDNIDYPVTFNVEYYDVNVFNVHGEVVYEHNNKLNLGLKADYQKFSNENNDIFWYKPAMRITFSGGYNLSDKILLKSDIFYNSQVYAKSYDPSENSTTLKGWLDLNLGGEYIYKKNLSVFVKLNNIASVRYSQWYKYPSYRLNLMGGLTYSF
jgi:hypothetical protein